MSKKIFTDNRKTILSFDVSRKSCNQKCNYCYVKQMETIYPAYNDKLKQNYILAKNKPNLLAATLNLEFKKSKKLRQQKRLIPIRMYGAGDFIPEHLEFLKNLDFKFFIISKNLVNNYSEYIRKLNKLSNCTSIILSYDSTNICNFDAKYKKIGNKIKYAYTGLPNEFIQFSGKKQFDIYFNTGKKNKEKLEARTYREQCPCDTGLIPHTAACIKCSKCWR